MRRDPAALSAETFDCLVVGAGVYGICAAWDAAQRGLRVALVDRGDFCAATSANSLKIAHGGLRYLQGLDVRRMRRSIRERRTLFRVAPHLVRPLPCLMPTRARPLTRHRWAMRTAMALNDLVSWDRNRRVAAPVRLPRGRVLSRDECLRRFPGLDPGGVTGGALWYDGLITDTERLAMSWLRRAVDAGAVAVNHFAATGLLRGPGGIEGVRGRDVPTGEAAEVRARVVVNACGPWMEGLRERDGRVCLALNLVVDRPPAGCAVAAGIGGARLFFLVPWRGKTMVGTAYFPRPAGAREASPTEEELARFVADVNAVHPAYALRREEVAFVHAGLLPVAPDGSRADRPRLEHGDGMISMQGEKWTTARNLAERAVDLVFRRLGRAPPPCRTAEIAVHGGESADLEELASGIRAAGIERGPAERLAARYGTAWHEVTRHAAEAHGPLPGTAGLRAEILHAVRDAMAVTLGDIDFGRTALASSGPTGDAALDECTALAARELGWSEMRAAEERTSLASRLRT